MNLYEETNMLLKQYNLKANRKLGQNFLINQDIIEEIVNNSKISSEDVVIEIGPGLGALTKELLKKSKKVIAIELDKNMVDILKNRFSNTNIEIIHDDILKINLKELIGGYDKVKVVANLPYYITTPIIMRLLEERLNIISITIMVQKEVGDRICAKPSSKDYGAITVSINYYTNSKKIIDVKRENFIPAPDVDSCVVRMDILKEPPVKLKDKKTFFDLIKSGFATRRKNIGNSLTGIGKSKEEIKKILDKVNIDYNLRAENLSIYDFAEISNNM